MKTGPEADGLYLDRIVELVMLIRDSLAGVGEADFLSDRTLGDATALRLGAIGELSRKLSTDVKTRQGAVPWDRMYRLRNIVAHHYDRLDYRIIWEIATTALEEILVACRAELEQLDR